MVNAGKILKIIILILIGLFVLLAIFFKIPYSSLKSEFKKDLNSLDKTNNKGILTKEDYECYPLAIQNYIKNNGFIGKKNMDYSFMEYKDVDFAQSPEKKLKINYSQYNFSNQANRIALIDSSIMGIPFEGYDYYINGKGGMVGMIGKLFKLFDVKGPDMDKGALCTYLSECLFVPSSILNNPYITFEEINPYNIKARIIDNEISVSGIFTFNENYELTKFYTEDRPQAQDDGTIRYVPWSANILSYKKTPDGVNFIDHVQIIWHYPEGDFIYFDGNLSKVLFK